MNCLALATRRPALLLACSLRASPIAGHAAEFGGLYVPPAQYGVSTAERSVFHSEAAQLQREVKLLIRQPLGAPLPMPVMLWLHGSADGKRSAATSMVEWSETTARAGYYSVSIAHAHRESGSRQLLCGVLGIADDATCKVYRYLNWDRPHDIRAVLDEVVRLGAGTLGGQVDPNRIAVGGHSAGAGGALTVAGASRIFVGAPMQIADPRPIAFLAFSPQQPGSEAFFDTRFQKERHSWTDVHRPVLSATGDGDSTCEPGSEPIGDTLFGRRIPFQRMPVDGNKYHLYLHSAQRLPHPIRAEGGEVPATAGGALVVVGRPRVSGRPCAAVARRAAVAAEQPHRTSQRRSRRVAAQMSKLDRRGRRRSLLHSSRPNLCHSRRTS